MFTGLFEGVSKDKWKICMSKVYKNLFFLPKDATLLGGGGVIVITPLHPRTPYNVLNKDRQHHPRWGNTDTD